LIHIRVVGAPFAEAARTVDKGMTRERIVGDATHRVDARGASSEP
jgi:hypothetical protein